MITTLVGNYPKVAERAYGTRLKWQRQELAGAQLEAAYQQVTRAVIQEQEQAGLDLLTDGQIRWDDLLRPIARGLDGFEINGLTRWFNNNVLYRRPVLVRKPSWKRPILVEDYRFAAGCTRKPVKAVLPGPYTFAVLSEDRVYKRLRPFALKMAELLRQEAGALAAAGAPLIQFDEPAIGFGKTDLKLAVEALTVATKGLKTSAGVTLYFGALDGAFAALQRTPVAVIGVDVVSDPKNLATLARAKITKELAVGCLDARNTKLESVRDLHAIFTTLKKRIPLDRVAVTPNCGLEFLPHPQAVAKVERLVEAVRTFSGQPKGGRSCC